MKDNARFQQQSIRALQRIIAAIEDGSLLVMDFRCDDLMCGLDKVHFTIDCIKVTRGMFNPPDVAEE